MATKARPKAKAVRRGEATEGLVFPPDVDGVLTAKHIVSLLDISERKFKQMLSTGDYPPHDFAIGKLHRWTVATHNEWVAGRKGGRDSDGGRQ